jgi:hypothetical protein
LAYSGIYLVASTTVAEVLTTPIEIAYPGVHRDFRGLRVPMSRADLVSAVANFNASGLRLPMVVAHPTDESQPLGFGTKLAITKGDRVSIVEAEGIDPTFKSIVNSGELNRISAKVRLPGHPKNSSDGFEFQHVGFFGRSPVAMQLLKEAAFSAQDDKEFYLMADDLDGSAKADATRTAEFAAKEAEFKARFAELNARQAKIEALEAGFAKMREIEPQMEKWLAQGRILPTERAGFVALFAALPDELEVCFAAADGDDVSTSAGEFLKDFIGGLKPRVVYGEVAGDTSASLSDRDSTASFGGMNVSEDSDELDGKIAAYCKKNGLDYDDDKDYMKAMNAVGGK